MTDERRELLRRLRRGLLISAMLPVLTSTLVAQTPVRLPLPVDGLAGAVAFEVPAPMGTVLTGLLLPSEGALTGWAPVWSSLQADGTLRESSTGAWIGKRPERWSKSVREGSVVAGFRVLIRLGKVETRQLQIFWREWKDGGASGPDAPSRVLGSPAEQKDEVRIVELALPQGSAPVGLYGQLFEGRLIQGSLMVRLPDKPASTTPSTQKSPPVPAVGGPQIPTVKAPTVTEPTLKK